MTCQMTMSLGVYVLGAAGAAERLRVEAHLPGCPQCQAELLHLSPLPGLLAGVPDSLLGNVPHSLPGPGQQLAQRARARAGPGRRGRRAVRIWQAAGAAASVAAVAGAATGSWLAANGPASRPATVTLTTANPATHVSATAALTATSWGTSIRLHLRGLPLNEPCRLIVWSRAGTAEVSGVWDAWRDGPVSIPGSAAWRPSDIASLQVVAGHKALVTLSAR